MLRNSAYRGIAYFGKTHTVPRSRITRPLRLRGGAASRNSANQERPREDWIGIPVPALVNEERFARAQELLQENKVRSRRRTIAPSVVQGLVSCPQVRLCSLAHLDALECAHDPLLIDASAPMAGDVSGVRCATTDPCVRICSIRSCGPRSFG